jgi:hypothetical protein
MLLLLQLVLWQVANEIASWLQPQLCRILVRHNACGKHLGIGLTSTYHMMQLLLQQLINAHTDYVQG